MAISGQKGFVIDGWTVSPSEGLLSRGGDTVRLEPKTMEVLVYFASRPNEVITRDELERDVWHGALVGYDAVTNTVIKLRKALQDDARHPRCIATIPKKGYQLIASISDIEDTQQSRETKVTETSPVTKPANKIEAQSSYKVFISVVIFIGITLLAVVWWWPAGNDQAAELPSIVVLPFENLSDDPKQEYLADGITEDIITDLSRISNLLVIASNTSIKYKNKQVTAEEVGSDLDVGFALKGTVRQVGNQIRVNAQLIDTKTGFNAWAARYDRKLTEVFAVQDEVTKSIANALAVKITQQEKQRLASVTTNSLEAYDFFQEGQRFYKIVTKESMEQAREMYRKAIELDPRYGRAYGAMAVTLAVDFRRSWTDSPQATLDYALELAQKAVELDDATPQTYFALGFVLLQRKEYEAAELAARHSVEIAPNFADGYGLLSLIYAYINKPEQSIKINKKAIRLNPYYTYEYLTSYGIAYYSLGDYAGSIKALEEAQERNSNAIQIKLYLAASYIRVGRQQDAEWIIEEIKVLNPTATIGSLRITAPFSNDLKKLILEDLRKAGLPE